jgi:hypothetical protein
MILAVVGVILIITGAFMITRKTAETWLQRRAGKPKESQEKLSYKPILLIGLGALLLAIATSGSSP